MVGYEYPKIEIGLTLLSCANFGPNVVQVALLKIYDMSKAVDRGMVMGDVKLLEKSGGKSGDWTA